MALAFGGRDIGDLSIGGGLEVDPRTGAAALRVPVPAPPGRHGLGPALTLAYSSGAGNSAFGAGWSLAGLPAIGIDTRFHVPRWDGTDGFQLGGEDLVPWLELKAGTWSPRGFVDGDWSVAFLRSRRGGAQVRIERWVHQPTGRVHFRTRDARNVVTIYGARPNAAARVADPADEARTFAWLPELQIDPHGNAVWLEYAAETLDGVDRSAPCERQRPSLAQRYLKRIRYGNVAPLALDEAIVSGALPAPLRWCFQLALDFGDHGAPDNVPASMPDRAWPAREDPFSSFRNGFEVRTYRLCRRLLAFHEIDELGAGPTLVGALVLTHKEDPAGSILREIAYVGYRRDADVVTSKAIPPLRMTYAPAASATSFTEAPAETQENVPAGLAGHRHTFVDLLGEGLPGILTESDRAWYYKPNLGGGQFGGQAMVLERPATRPGTFGFGDVDRDGNTDLSQLSGRLAGSYQLDREEATWTGFRPFPALPHVEALGGRAQWVDLNGDGRADIVVAKADSFVWFASDGDGFLPPVEIPTPGGINAAPTLAADAALDFFFADMSGDGLPDLVRVQNGRVEYWPSLGNGRFGDGVLMDGAPEFAPDAEFDAARLRFVDLDGSGASDLVYLGQGEVTCWINAAGNGLVPGPHLAGLPYFDNVSSVQVLDFLGDGRACLVWSSPLPGRESPLEYLPLTPRDRPRLLLAVDDSLGRETRLTYSSSATHYLRDIASGRGWSTRLPGHSPVVDRCEVIDQIGNTRSVQRFEYHDGYYDGVERVPRGFGQVDVSDADAVDGTAPGPGAAAFAAPALVRTWFHLGTPMWGHHRPRDTYAGDPDLPWLAHHVVEDAAGLMPEAIEDGLRALAGQVIRREVYAVDEHGKPGSHPFDVQQSSYRLRSTQPAHGGAEAAFSVTKVEDATWSYEQAPGDPRVNHHVIIETDNYERPVRDAAIGYARRDGRPRDIAAQDRCLVAVHDHDQLNIDERDRFELGIPIEGKSYELVGIRPGKTALFMREQLRGQPVAAALAMPGPHDVDPPDDPGQGPRARLLSWDQSFYWNDARAAALPLRQVGLSTMVHHEEAACFSSTFVADALAGRVDDGRLSALGYLQRGDLWWQIDEIHHFTPAAEFSQRAAIERADGAITRFTYDAHALAITTVIDPLGNATAGVIDYHQLAPWRLTDPNGNVSEVRYDPLGVVITATSYGHVGDEAWGFDALDAVALRAPATVADALADPNHYLQGAARYAWYDLGAWSHDGMPTTVLGLTREDLLHDGAGTGTDAGRVQIGIAYLDGLGRALQEKVLVEAGPAIQRDEQGEVVIDAGGRPVPATTDPRWRASGHVVYNGKQHPGRQYEPFFTSSPAFEGDEVLQHVGVPTLTRYDAVGRAVGQDFPNGTFTQSTFNAWTLEQADPNDTVLVSAYRALREGLPVGDAERQAYEHAKAHAGTAGLTYLDPLGRPSGSLAQGGVTAADSRSEMLLDVEGQPRAVIDPRGLIAFTYRRDMQGRLFFEHGLDAGDAWSLPDAHDRVINAWNARGFEIERGYDLGDRPLYTHVRGGDGASPLDHRVEEWAYGESLADPIDAARRNMLGRIVTTRDSACETSASRFDPLGSVLGAIRRLRADVDTEPDWRAPVPLEAESFTTAAIHDALGRPRRDTLPDGTVRAYEYLPSGPLARVRITTPDGTLVDKPIVDGASYGARGERQTLALGNGAALQYGYDAETYRLKTQTATLGARSLQRLRYTHDPVGNLVRLTDDAQEGPGAVISGVVVPARRDYVYDAHYRLRQASGRVHQALLQTDHVPSNPGTFKGTRHLSLSNGAAVERFTRTYDYDASGNLRYIKHVGKSQSFTTDLWISATSNRSLPALDANNLPIPAPENNFDGAGNLREMPHLRRIDWSFRGSLGRAVVIERPGGTDDGERYVYGGDGLRVRKISTRVVYGGKIETTEKVYFGDSERKRIRLDGTVIFERWTTHVGDGAQRVALVHRWIKDDHAREVDDVTQPRVHYQLNTHQGSSALELDETGNLISYEEYFPYGGTAFLAGDNLREVARKEYRYSGKECDDVTGLYDYGHRYYAPWMGRWLSPDPIGPKDDLNLYQFVRGNPVNNVDHDGLETVGAQQQGGNVHYRRIAEGWAGAENAPGQGEITILHPDTHQMVRVTGQQALEIARQHNINLEIQVIDPELGAQRRKDELRAVDEAVRGLAEALGNPLPAGTAGAPSGGTGAGTGNQANGSSSSSDASATGAHDQTGKGGLGASDLGAGGMGAGRGTQGGGAGNGPGSGAGNSTGNGAGPSLAGNGVGIGTGTGTGTGTRAGTGTGLGTHHGKGSGDGTGNGAGIGAGHGKGKEGGDGNGTKGAGTGNGKGTADGGKGHGTHGTGRRTTDDSGARDSGIGTKTGGTSDQLPSLDGPPATPGMNENGGDANGAPDGSRFGIRGGTGEKLTGDGIVGGSKSGIPGGKSTGHEGGTRDGVPNPPRDGALDIATRVAGVANLELDSGKKDGQVGGIPGGHGSTNLGAFGQLGYIAVTIIGLIGPGKVWNGIKNGIRAGLRLGARGLLREGVALLERRALGLLGGLAKSMLGLRKVAGSLAEAWTGRGTRTFYSAQGAEDIARLLERGGVPWPQGALDGSLRDIFGPGLYTWATREQAESYAQALAKYGASDLKILAHRISLQDLGRLNTANLTRMTDEAANLIYDMGVNHGFEQIVRTTGNFGAEHFFRREMFPLFTNWVLK
jgi:RHS repeat-associated protein